MVWIATLRLVHDDESIVNAITREVNEALPPLVVRRAFVGRVTNAGPDPFGATIVELTGRFPELADRNVTLTVELDPGRVGWRLTADLWEYRDAEDSQRHVYDFGYSRVLTVDRAIEEGVRLARAGCAQLLGYADPTAG